MVKVTFTSTWIVTNDNYYCSTTLQKVCNHYNNIMGKDLINHFFILLIKLMLSHIVKVQGVKVVLSRFHQYS